MRELLLASVAIWPVAALAGVCDLAPSGPIKITRDYQVVHGLSIRAYGQTPGEVALLAGAHRTATVTADSDSICWGMPAWNFRPLVREQPSVTIKLLERTNSITLDPNDPPRWVNSLMVRRHEHLPLRLAAR